MIDELEIKKEQYGKTLMTGIVLGRKERIAYEKINEIVRYQNSREEDINMIIDTLKMNGLLVEK